MDYAKNELNVVYEKSYSNGLRASVKCYGADDVVEGVAIMHKENVGVSITGNSTNPTRFQHPVAGTYKKRMYRAGQEILLSSIRWWYRTYTSPGQHGSRSCFLRYDRYYGTYAL